MEHLKDKYDKKYMLFEMSNEEFEKARNDLHFYRAEQIAKIFSVITDDKLDLSKKIEMVRESVLNIEEFSNLIAIIYVVNNNLGNVPERE